MNRISTAVLILFCSLMIFVGCNGQKRPAGMPKLYPVTLTITQANAPLVDAVVSVIPEEACQWSGGGTTDANGKLELYTQGQYKGIPLGKYKVTVSKEIIENPQMKESDPPGKRFSVIDSVCGTRETTPLQIDVNESTKEFTLDVGKAVKRRCKQLKR